MKQAAMADSKRIFAANRAVSRIALVAEAREGMSERSRVHEAGSLRVRFPGSASEELEAVIINTAGGVAGGDRLDLEFSAGPGVELCVTSAAAEKIYRSLGPDATIRVKLDVGPGAALAWLPQETILFNQARVDRAIDVDLGGGARLMLAETVVFGRSGMGEAVVNGRFVDRWRVRRSGRLMFAETVRLDGAIAQKLGERAVAAGGVAVATVLVIPGDEATVAAVRGLGETFAGEVGVSTWNGFALVRLCARDGARLRHDLIAVLTMLRDGSMPRLWLN